MRLGRLKYGVKGECQGKNIKQINKDWGETITRMMKRKMRYVGHIIRGSSRPVLQLALEWKGESTIRKEDGGQDETGLLM